MAIALATVKAALRIDYTDDDAELTRLIAVGVAWVENYCGFKLTSATRTMKLREFRRTVLAVQPVTSLTSVTYVDGGGNQTLDADLRWLDTSGDLAAIEFLEPLPIPDEGTLITVTYVAGYATEPNEVVQAVISLVGAWYNNPEAHAPTMLSPTPLGAQFMLEHLRIRGPFS
jgi:uncharacterized phiE125 gp8 family phage protein